MKIIISFLIKSGIFKSVMWVLIMAFKELEFLSLDLLSVAIASVVGWLNSAIGIVLFAFSRSLKSFTKIIVLSQAVRLIFVLTATLVLMANDLVTKVDYVLGIILFVLVFLALEIWSYLQEFKTATP